MGIEHLVEKTKESAADVVDPIAAVAAFFGLREQARRQERSEELIQVQEALLAEALDAAAQGASRARKAGKKGVFISDRRST